MLTILWQLNHNLKKSEWASKPSSVHPAITGWAAIYLDRRLPVGSPKAAAYPSLNRAGPTLGSV